MILVWVIEADSYILPDCFLEAIEQGEVLPDCKAQLIGNYTLNGYSVSSLISS